MFPFLRDSRVKCEQYNKSGKKQKQKFQQKGMVWLGVCLEEITLLVISEERNGHPQSLYRKSFASSSVTTGRFSSHLSPFPKMVYRVFSSCN